MRRYMTSLRMVVLGGVWCVAGSVRAQSCIEYRDFLHTAGALETSDAAIGVAVAGGYAYVADRFSGLQVIDISSHGMPQIVGAVDTPGRAWGVAVSGRYAYVADRSGGLHVIDVGDPRAPHLVGTVETPDAYGVAAVAGHVYVADTWAGLLVIDASNPSAPRLVGSQPLSIAAGVAVASGYAYVADFGSGLRVVDVSDPTAPRLVSSTAAPDPEEGPVDVAVVGDHVYVTQGRQGLEVIDVSDPSSPQKVAHLYMPGISRSVAVSGTHAYVTNTLLPGLQVVDIRDPTSPQILGSTSTPGTALGVWAADSLAYVAAAYSGLQIIDSSNPRSPTVGSVDTVSDSWGVAVSGQHAYIADYSGGLHVIDISDPLLPRIVGSLQTANLAYDVAVVGDYVCVAEVVRLEIVDVRNPTSPQVVGSIETLDSGGATELAVDGSTLYFASSPGAMQAVDVSDPTLPRIVGWSNVVVHATDLAVANGYAYVAGGDLFSPSSFSVFDIGELPTLRRIGSTNGYGSAKGVAVAGDFAYVTDGQTLQVLDVSTPALPTVVGSVQFPNFLKGVAVAGHYAYVADGFWIHVVDISDPRVPRVVSSILMQGSTSIALTDQHVCVAASTFGLGIVSRQCDGPTPVLLLNFSVTLVGAEVEVRWRISDGAEVDAFRLVASSEFGAWEVPVPVENVLSFAVRDRSAKLKEAASVTYTLFCHSTAGQWMQLAEQSLSLRSLAQEFRLLDPYPNPFNPRVNIPFTLDVTRRVRMTVYDVAGREIVRLWDGEAPRGRNQVAWDGLDARGQRVGSGVYVVRLESTRRLQARRLVLLR